MSTQTPKPPPAMVPVPSSLRALAEALQKRKKRRASRWSEEDKRKIFGRYLAGEHQADIGVSFGVTAQTIMNLINRTIKDGLAEEEASAKPAPVIYDPKKGRP